jgi:hypothetical protein
MTNFQGNWENGLKDVMIGEIKAAVGYFDRVYHALVEVAGIANHPEARAITQSLSVDFYEMLDEAVFHSDLALERLPKSQMREARQLIRTGGQVFTSILELNLHPEKSLDLAGHFINLTYLYARDFHILTEDESDIEIQLPRTNLIEELEPPDNEAIPLFGIPEGKMAEMDGQEVPRVFALERQREILFERYLAWGHESMLEKKHKDGLEWFQKALNLRETAEALTLVAWGHALENDNNKARALCLRAIQKDPTYGPPYNDLGTYLLEEGQQDEALKWFELAKKAQNYQNREYPFINAGRIYMHQKRFKKALEEFSFALSLAPHHEELNELVTKVQSALTKSDFIAGQASDFPPPPVF